MTPPDRQRLSARARSTVTACCLMACALLVAGAAGTASAAPAADPALLPAGQGEVCSAAWIAEGAGVVAHEAALAQLAAPPAIEPPMTMVAGRPGAGHPLGDRQPASAALSEWPPGEPDQSVTRPRDTYFPFQRNLLMIGATEAWEYSHGGDDVTLAIIGDGVDYAHPDLREKIWRNADEVPDNGRDDDGNGYVDDVIGWDFSRGVPDPQYASMEHDYCGPTRQCAGVRGTVQAGIAAASTNNGEGIAGVDWHARIMPLKVSRYYTYPDDQTGTERVLLSAYPWWLTESICYAANSGARVILFTFGVTPDYFSTFGPETVTRMQQAIDYAIQHSGAVIVAAAGECGQWHPLCARHDNPPYYPASFERVIGVQSINRDYEQRDYASYGDWVDLVAPGEGMHTTYPIQDPYYAVTNGYAFPSVVAAAHVAGAAALALSVDPRLSSYRAEQLLLQSARRDRHGLPYDRQRHGGIPWNPRWGHGLLDIERVVEGMPWQVRVEPQQVMKLATRDGPWPTQRFTNRYLNSVAWEIRSDEFWVETPPPVQPRAGAPSHVTVTANLQTLRRERGGRLQSDRPYQAELRACPVNEINPDECQTIKLELQIADRVERIYLPLAQDGGHALPLLDGE